MGKQPPGAGKPHAAPCGPIQQVGAIYVYTSAGGSQRPSSAPRRGWRWWDFHARAELGEIALMGDTSLSSKLLEDEGPAVEGGGPAGLAPVV